MAIFHFMQKKSGTTRGPPSTNLSAISRLHPFFPQEDYHPTFCGTVQDTLRDIPDTRSVYPPTDDKSSSISPARLCSWVPSNGSSTEGEGGERERERGNENNRDERAAQLTSPRERCGASSVDLILWFQRLQREVGNSVSFPLVVASCISIWLVVQRPIRKTTTPWRKTDSSGMNPTRWSNFESLRLTVDIKRIR